MTSFRNIRNDAKKNIIGKSELISNFQSAEIIIKTLQRAEFDSRSFSKKLKPIFYSKNKLSTCKKVWYVLRKYFEYEAEPKENQTAKTLARYIVSRKGDCKHYSTASVGILLQCGIPAWFTYIRQIPNDKNKGHIYCSALVNGKIVIIDPCRKVFNSEAKYIYKKNIPPIKK